MGGGSGGFHGTGNRQGQGMENNTPRPVPRPPRSPFIATPTRRLPHASEFAHIIKVEHGGRAVVLVGRASHGEIHARTVWEGPQDRGRVAVLDAFCGLVEEAHGLSEPLTVVVPTSLAQNLAACGFADPQIIIGAKTGPNYLSETHQLADAWRDQQPATTRERVLVVATDASVGLRTGSAAIACISQDGRTRELRLSRRHDVTLCELRAILLAVETYHGALHIQSDSLTAVTLLTSGKVDPKARRYASLLARIEAASAGRTVTYEWVRGHNGHPLNEAANRLAIATRRGAELHLPPGIRRKVRTQITADLACA
jgi:ribonuclease HI